MSRLNLEKIAVIAGVCCLAIGIAWIGIWSHRLQGNPNMNWLTSEVPTPLAPRLMVLAGMILIIGTGVAWLIGRFQKRTPDRLSR